MNTGDHATLKLKLGSVPTQSSMVHTSFNVSGHPILLDAMAMKQSGPHVSSDVRARPYTSSLTPVYVVVAKDSEGI
jgi:hypothetical protein